MKKPRPIRKLRRTGSEVDHQRICKPQISPHARRFCPLEFTTFHKK